MGDRTYREVGMKVDAGSKERDRDVGVKIPLFLSINKLKVSRQGREGGLWEREE